MMYDIAAILGVIVMGGLLTAGRYLGLKGVGTNDLPLAVVGSLLSIIAYGLFGAAILTRYPTGIHIPAILVTAGITLAITLAAAVYVYTTDSSQEKWASYSGTLFIVGIVAVAIGYVASPFLWVGFFAFLLGFICDLVYEIWMVSSSRRTPMANGFAIYIAFAGVFVHILQLVLRAMAKD